MRVEIHDVDHGSCITVTSPQGHLLMFDCGSNRKKSWFPSIEYLGRTIDMLMVTNLDEDHVDDLPGVCNSTTIKALYSNPSIAASDLMIMKRGKMDAGVRCAHDILAHHRTGEIGDFSRDLGGIHWHVFCNKIDYFDSEFFKSNNLSLAVFVTFGRFTILFGGDMERAGWERLVKHQAFRDRLSEVQVYVASHHGRENGRCPKLLKYMRPDVVIFSDGPKVHDTQETGDWYARQAKGIIDRDKPWTKNGPALRKVMTTRKDGHLAIEANASGSYTVYYSRSEPDLEAIANLFGTLPNPVVGSTRPYL